MQFFPTTQLREITWHVIPEMFGIMRDRSKPIAKRSIRSVLGIVGEEAFQSICEKRGWKRVRYTMMTGFRMECPDYHHDDDDTCGHPDHVEFPYIVELVVFDRDSNDTEGLKVYQCVNFMASMEDIFSRIFNINYRLGRVGITDDMPVTVVAHLVCPVLKWLNYGKGGLDE